MSDGFVGADVEGLRHMSGSVNAHADTVEFVEREASYRISRIAQIWVGPGADMFQYEWYQRHAPALRNAAAHLAHAAALLQQNAEQQASASNNLDRGGMAGAGGGPFGLPGWVGDTAGHVGGFLFGDVLNFWTGGDDSFPWGTAAANLFYLNRVRQFLSGAGPLPLLNNGFVGRHALGLLSRAPGSVGSAASWLSSPAATPWVRGLGIAGGVVSTGMGAYNLYQQGNPIDAFQREGAGYVADVASTAFSASSTAFLIAPNPVTGALVIGTGVVWLGAEVVDHWDEVSATASAAWDVGSGFVSDVGSAGADLASATVDGAVDLASGAFDAGADLLGDAGSFIGGLAPDWF